MTLAFDPNAQPTPIMPEWATYTPNRKPQWKVHKRKGDAKNAFYHHNDIILFRFEDTKWVEKFRMEGVAEQCSDCDNNLWTERHSTSYVDRVYRSYHGRRMWDKSTDDLAMVTVCLNCAHKRWRPGT